MAFGAPRQDFIDCDLSQLTQRRRTAGEDLMAFTEGRPLAVTIEGVVVENFTKRGSNKPEIVYELYVRELAKPLKLTTTRMNTIGKLLGTSRTGQWTGKVIQIRAVEDWITEDDGTRKQIFCIEYVGVAPAAAQMPAKMDITGYALEAAQRQAQLPGASGGDVPAGLRGSATSTAATAAPLQTPGVIGEDRAVAITGNLARRDKTWADLEPWIARSAPQIGRVIAGILPPAWPQAALPWITTYLQSCPPTKPLPNPSELQAIRDGWRNPVNVTDPADRVGAKPAGAMDPDDIPF